MSEQIEGFHWDDVITRIECLPRGEALKIDLTDGTDITVCHRESGNVVVRMGDSQWIPYSLPEVVALIRSGVAKRAQA